MNDAPSNTRPSIRAATADDARAVAALQIASWQSTYRSDLPGAYLEGLDLEARTGRWRDVMDRPGVEVLVAETVAGLAGFAAFGPALDADLDPAQTAQLYNLHVDPTRWSQGTGSDLWTAMMERLRGRWRELALWVLPTNHRARGFYERRGLRPDGGRQREPLAPGVAFDEIRYRGALAAPRSTPATE
ncbi:MAG: GNAT family N-acetyltransferase [Gemmatimonadales bacterium]|nr:GNAT family N-acetyltransferase [Gemmatimonadales bacterium]